MMMALLQRPLAAIRATLRLERSRHVVHMRAKADGHLFEHMVGLDVERLWRDLTSRVAIADVPGDARQFDSAVCMDLDQRLRRRDDLHDRTVLQQ